MRIGILSDTHDNIEKTTAAVALFNKEGVEQVLHAGDFIAPFMIGTLADLTAPMTGVFGNNDGDRALLTVKCAEHRHLRIAGTFARLETGGARIGLIHGNDSSLLHTLIAGGALDIIVYGHTHKPEVRRQGPVLIVNPGEVYGCLTGRSTIAFLDTEKMDAEIVDI